MVHAGEVVRHKQTYVGNDLNYAFRLLNQPAAQRPAVAVAQVTQRPYQLQAGHIGGGAAAVTSLGPPAGGQQAGVGVEAHGLDRQPTTPGEPPKDRAGTRPLPRRSWYGGGRQAAAGVALRPRRGRSRLNSSSRTLNAYGQEPTAKARVPTSREVRVMVLSVIGGVTKVVVEVEDQR